MFEDDLLISQTDLVNPLNNFASYGTKKALDQCGWIPDLKINHHKSFNIRDHYKKKDQYTQSLLVNTHLYTQPDHLIFNNPRIEKIRQKSVQRVSNEPYKLSQTKIQYKLGSKKGIKTKQPLLINVNNKYFPEARWKSNRLKVSNNIKNKKSEQKVIKNSKLNFQIVKKTNNSAIYHDPYRALNHRLQNLVLL